MNNQIYSKEFKDWFGDWENDEKNSSKVVDDSGKPLVVYHGTNFNFDVFDMSYNGKNYNDNASKIGIFFTTNKDDAKFYGKNVKSFYLNLKRIKVIDDNVIEEYVDEWLRKLEDEDPEEYEFQISTKQYQNSSSINKGLELAIIDYKRYGIDGKKIETNGEPDWYVAFHPNQIKSVNNNGQWNKNSNNIYEYRIYLQNRNIIY